MIELAAVEIVDRRLSGNHFHRYINPERASDEGALQVHGLSEEFLRDKPKFRDIVNEWLDFVNGAELVIHNAPFDTGFLDRELDLLDLKPIGEYCANIVDTLQMAQLHPGKKNNLNALRTLPDRQLDAHAARRAARRQSLAAVYLAMTRGQDSLIMDRARAAGGQRNWLAAGKPN